MSWKRVTTIVGLALVLVIGLTGCPKKAPLTPTSAPTGPDTTYEEGVASYKTMTESPSGPVRFVFDWGDGPPDTTDDTYASEEEAIVSHSWSTAGTYSVRAMAVLDADPTLASDWSPSHTVLVLPNDPPVIESISGPPVAVKGVNAYIRVYTSDPDGDSVKLTVKWGDGKDTTTGFARTPGNIRVGHAYADIETLYARATLTDVRGAKSETDSIRIIVGTAGAVKWTWWNNDEDQGPLITSAVYANDGSRDVVYSACDDDYKMYRVKVEDGRDVGGQSTRFPEYVFTGHPSMNPSTGDIAAGSDEGILYVWDRGLGNERRWPGWTNEDSCNYIEWGSGAWNGTKLYIPHADDSIFYFEVNASAINRISAYGVRAAIVDAPVIDAAGNIYFGTDSGYLHKMSGTLAPMWKVSLQSNGEIHGPVIGADGTVYAVTDQGKVCAINPADGSTRWTRQLDAEGSRPALTGGTMFIGSSSGKFYAITLSDGSVLWQKQFGNSEFATTPIIVTGTPALLYAVNDIDVVYCVERGSGTILWSCDCPSFLPDKKGRSRLQTVDYLPNPTITATGDVIVVGSDALYGVAGYTDKVLDTNQPWPKWQKNHYNSGK
jgi:outer membrane protein assembly factor BamB